MRKDNHAVYKDKEGTRLPGVTTITGELGWNKQVLVTWANKLGLQGIEAAKYVDDKAAIGTLAHQMILDHLRREKTDTSDYSANQISLAENCVLSYLAWEKGKKIEPVMVETPLVHEELKYGGTMDFYGKIDGVMTLLDFKTGKGIYDEYFIQVAGGYALLLERYYYPISDIQILNIPRTEDEAFQIKPLPQAKWQVCKDIFTNCLNTYKAKKLLKGE